MTEGPPELTRCACDQRGQMGTRGQPVMARVSASPDTPGVLGTSGDVASDISPQVMLVVSAKEICPRASPACPQDQIVSAPYSANASPVSPLVPGDITAAHPQTVGISKLCQLLKMDPDLLHSQGLLDAADMEMIETGEFNATQIVSYLLGWQAVGYTIPFAVLEKKSMRQKLSELGVTWPNGEHLDEWLSLSG